jgi:hypothetical protein
MPRRPLIFALAFLWLFPVPVRAEICAAATQLARIHDAHLALGDASRQVRERAAIGLLAVLLPDADPARLAQALATIDQPPDEARLAQIFLLAAKAAKTIARTGRASLDAGHSADTAWLADTIIQTGCADAWPSGGRAPAPLQISKLPFRNPVDTPAKHLTLFAFLAAAVAGTAALRRTKLFRKQELRRQSRKAVSLKATATLPDKERKGIKVLDLSTGGMKIALKDAPEPGTSLAIDINGRSFAASITWRNDFYAGVLLDTPLTKPQLQALLTLSASHAGGRSARESK